MSEDNTGVGGAWWGATCVGCAGFLATVGLGIHLFGAAGAFIGAGAGLLVLWGTAEGTYTLLRDFTNLK